MREPPPRIKGLLVGDDSVGKRTLARRCAGCQPPARWERYIVMEDALIASTRVPNRSPWDTEGNNKSKRLSITRQKSDEETAVDISMWTLNSLQDEELYMHRNLILQNVQVIGICYSISDRQSLHNAIYKWFPKMRHYHPSVPVLLIGCKSDERGSRGVISVEEGLKASRQIDAAEWMECVALEQKSADRVAHYMAWYGYHYVKDQEPERENTCIIL